MFRSVILFFVLLFKYSFVEAQITWGTAELISGTIENDPGSSQVGIDNKGNIVAVWTQRQSGYYVVQGAVHLNSSSSWTISTLSSPSDHACAPQLSINASGMAVAVWSESDIVKAAMIKTESPTPTWSSATSLSTSNAIDPQIGLDGSGNALVIWQNTANPTTTSIQGNSFVNGSWSGVFSISQGPGSAITPRIAVNEAGMGVAVWRECVTMNDITIGIIKAAIYSNPSWGSPISLSQGNSSLPQGSSSLPQVAIDASGNAIAIWRLSQDGNFTIQASGFNGQEWSPPIPLPSSGTGADESIIPNDLNITIDPESGFALACWSIKTDSFTSVIQTSQSSTSDPTNWSMRVNLGEGFSVTPDAATFGSEAEVIWSQSNCTNGFSIETAFLTGNQAKTLFGPSMLADEPKIAINSAGTAVAVWRGVGRDPDGVIGIWAITGTGKKQLLMTPCITPNIGSPAGGTLIKITLREGGSNTVTDVYFGSQKATSFKIMSDTEIVACAPQAEAPVTGRVKVNVLVKTETGSSSIKDLCNEFTYVEVTPAPPASICGKQIRNRFSTQADLVNLVKWSASPTEGVTSYDLYRNGKLVATIPVEKKRVFKDKNRKKGRKYVYSVTARVGSNESEPRRVTIPYRKGESCQSSKKKCPANPYLIALRLTRGEK